jgi:uncharacterized Tic20 family protein
MQPTEDERVLASLAHAGIVTNAANLAGMIGAALIWATQREKSAYVRAHALQALVYQGACLLIGLLLILFWSMCLGLSLLPAVFWPELHRTAPPNLFWLALIGGVVPLGFVICATLYGLYASIQAYRGRLFRYLLIGRLAPDPLVPPPAAVASAEPPPPPAEAQPQEAQPDAGRRRRPRRSNVSVEE